MKKLVLYSDEELWKKAVDLNISRRFLKSVLLQIFQRELKKNFFKEIENDILYGVSLDEKEEERQPLGYLLTSISSDRENIKELRKKEGVM